MQNDGPSKLKINSILILCVMAVILLFFGVFGSNASSFLTGNVIGTSVESTDAVEEALNEAIIIPEKAISSLNEEGKYALILNVLKLKSLDNKITKLQFADKVSKIADSIDALGDKEVIAQWESMIPCLESGCGEEYYKLVTLITNNAMIVQSEQSFVKSLFSSVSKYSYVPELLKSVIALEKASDNGNLVELSRATTLVNTHMSKVDSVIVQDLWNELIACDFKCFLYDNLLTEIVKYRLEQF